MTVSHPVPDELLLDYAVGSTGPGKSLLVATHLAMCESSRERFVMLEEVGGALLDSIEGARLERISAEALLARADQATDVPEASWPLGPGARLPAQVVEPKRKLAGISLPPPLAGFTAELDEPRAWRPLGLGIEAAVLSISGPEGKTQLLRARAGARILDHTHVGEELILILKGAFVDRGERFGPGDVGVNDGTVTHAPMIEPGEDCLCLAVTEGPIRFVGRHAWLFNLFNRF